MYMLL